MILTEIRHCSDRASLGCCGDVTKTSFYFGKMYVAVGGGQEHCERRGGKRCRL